MSTLPHAKQVTRGTFCMLRELSSVLYDVLEGWNGGGVGGRSKREGDICIHIAD